MVRDATAEAILTSRSRQSEQASRSDGQLLQVFISRSNQTAEAAFATLIERHGAMVHRVCLDVLQDREDARDATQAAFLVLARKAGSIRKPEALGPWLHGVALRLARRARSEAARRRAVERGKVEMMRQEQAPADAPEDLPHEELHEEIDRLPEKYRKPLILCYMQGCTQAQAAVRLGWPLGTVQVRLHRGRERLRSRLLRRGIGPMVLSTMSLATPASVRASDLGRAWTESTAAEAVRFASGEASTGLVSSTVRNLAESTLSTMAFGPIKLTSLLAMVLLISTSVFFVTPWSSFVDPETRSRSPVSTENLSPSRPTSHPARSFPSETRVSALEAPNEGDERHVRQEQTTAKPPPSAVQPGKGRREITYLSPGRVRDHAPGEHPRAELPNLGRELFERVWSRDDPRSHGGDGLGPVFNGTSCVACHNLGGVGGAGGVEHNIEIATVNDQLNQGMGYFYSFSMDFGAGRFEYQIGNAPGGAAGRGNRLDARAAVAVHPGFKESPSVVLHSYGTDPDYNTWRALVPGQHGTILIRTSERNPPPLFGAGLIDSIPDEVIEAAARRKVVGNGAIRGRVSRLKDGRIGRFGWKAQTGSLKEFVISAAAGEIGLEVPARHQAADPRLPGLAAPGLDMNQDECDALTQYVRGLPLPVALKPADDGDVAQVKSGERLFRTIGCASCHLPRLGNVESIFSDLLLHDMGPQLEDSASYSVFVGAPAEIMPNRDQDQATGGSATIQEWRTPPLWGLRDSGPYLHDGRAETIEQAILLHAGQGTLAARRFAELSPHRKRQLMTFLNTLAAPEEKN
jgi:RNA polymerase sigma factor (sigma-70 family)